MIRNCSKTFRRTTASSVCEMAKTTADDDDDDGGDHDCWPFEPTNQ